MSFGPFGNLQPDQPRELPTEPERRFYRYRCNICNESMMSDEALQLHIITHMLASIIVRLDELRTTLAECGSVGGREGEGGRKSA